MKSSYFCIFYLYNFLFGYIPYGTYIYEIYSSSGAMIHLNAYPNYGFNDWMQLNFKSTNSGNFYDNSFDSNTNNLLPFSGTFKIQL